MAASAAAAARRQRRQRAEAAVETTVVATGVAVRGPEVVLGYKAALGPASVFLQREGVRIKGMDQGYGSRVWIMQYHAVWIGVSIMEYGSCVGPGP